MTQDTAEMTDDDREVHELVEQLFGRLDKMVDEMFD